MSTYDYAENHEWLCAEVKRLRAVLDATLALDDDMRRTGFSGYEGCPALPEWNARLDR